MQHAKQTLNSGQESRSCLLSYKHTQVPPLVANYLMSYMHKQAIRSMKTVWELDTQGDFAVHITTSLQVQERFVGASLVSEPINTTQWRRLRQSDPEGELPKNGKYWLGRAVVWRPILRARSDLSPRQGINGAEQRPEKRRLRPPAVTIHSVAARPLISLPNSFRGPGMKQCLVSGSVNIRGCNS